MIETLLPRAVVVVHATPEMAEQALHPEEARYAAEMGASRRREFTLGRACARAALAKLGLSGPVLRDRRAPRWPAGAVGSLTHCEGFCAAAVARSRDLRALGIDAELDTPLSERVAARICTPEERAHLACLPPLASGQWEKLVFSAKEAFYKAYFPLAGSFLGFHDAALHFEPETRSFRVRVLREGAPPPHHARGRYALAPPHVLAAVAIGWDEPPPGAA